MRHSAIAIVLLSGTLAGCEARSGVGLGSSQPGGARAAASLGGGASSDELRTDERGNLQAVIYELGTPVPFDQVFADVQIVPRFKGEFDTAAQFEQRQAAARARCKERYLIATPVVPEQIRYDADKQVLIVSIYALQNIMVGPDELDALFRSDSELNKAGVEVKYGTSFDPNVLWAFPRDRRDVGTYDGQNPFGVHATIIKQEETARGVFERKGASRWGNEDVWFRRQPEYKRGSPPVAFEIKADPDRASALKQDGGLHAAVLVAPKFPFYATGVHGSTPTLQHPYDRTTTVRYLIGDIQGVALYDVNGQLLATRETR